MPWSLTSSFRGIGPSFNVLQSNYGNFKSRLFTPEEPLTDTGVTWDLTNFGDTEEEGDEVERPLDETG